MTKNLKLITLSLMFSSVTLFANEITNYQGNKTIFVFDHDTISKIMIENDTKRIIRGEFSFRNDTREVFKMKCYWNTPNPDTLRCDYEKRN